LTSIDEPKKNPAEYDLLMIGTPVWRGSVSIPIKTYCTKMKDRVGKVAFFLTQDGDESQAFEEMKAILGREPISSLALNRKKEVESGTYVTKLNAFIGKIQEDMMKA
jgi:hypothetical protein